MPSLKEPKWNWGRIGDIAESAIKKAFTEPKYGFLHNLLKNIEGYRLNLRRITRSPIYEGYEEVSITEYCDGSRNL